MKTETLVFTALAFYAGYKLSGNRTNYTIPDASVFDNPNILHDAQTVNDGPPPVNLTHNGNVIPPNIQQPTNISGL